MDYNKLRKQLINFEGNVNKVYVDTMGYKTAGIGHLLTGADKNMAVGTKVTENQIEDWFKEDVQAAEKIAIEWVGPTWDTLSETRQRIFVDLAFNLGNKLYDFKNTRKFVQAGNWEQVAANLKNSLWYTQVKRRGVELTKALVADKFTWE